LQSYRLMPDVSVKDYSQRLLEDQGKSSEMRSIYYQSLVRVGQAMSYWGYIP
jgi:hypothetical protein